MHELRSHGGEVDDPLEPYRQVRRAAHDGRPWVLANMVAGLDGTAAIGGRVAALSTPADAVLFRRMRALADLVLVGAQTVRQEGYGPVVLDDDLAASRRAAGLAPARVAIVSSSIDLDPQLPVFARALPDAPPLIVTAARSDTSGLSSTSAEVVVAGTDRVDLRAALVALGDRSVEVVLCEGGPSLLGQLIALDLLDEYCLTVVPLVGGDPLPVVDTTAMTGLTAFHLNHVFREEGTVFLNYLRERP